MFDIFFQGIIQGLTEFLPVSSSGHLTLFQYFTGSKDIEANMLTSIALHFGTLIAVLYFFRKDLMPFLTIKGWKEATNRRLAALIVCSSVPTALIGLGCKKTFEKIFSTPSYVSIGLFITGLMLLMSEKIGKSVADDKKIDINSLSWLKAFFIGVAQGIAVTPGISRSGSTITASLLAKLKSEDAAKYSFLLMIPAVGGATLLEIIKVAKNGLPASVEPWPLFIGVIVSTITGLLSLRFLVFIIKKQKLAIFSYYLFVVSILSLIAIYYGYHF